MVNWQPSPFEDIINAFDNNVIDINEIDSVREKQMTVAEYWRAHSISDDDMSNIEETYAETMPNEDQSKICCEIQQILKECTNIPGRERPLKYRETHKNRPITESILYGSKWPILMDQQFFKFTNTATDKDCDSADSNELDCCNVQYNRIDNSLSTSINGSYGSNSSCSGMSVSSASSPIGHSDPPYKRLKANYLSQVNTARFFGDLEAEKDKFVSPKQLYAIKKH